MLCQNCGQREATTHIKRIINGHADERYLCPACVKEGGLLESGALLGLPDIGFHLSDLFSGILGSSMQAGAPAQALRCGFCGSSLNEIARSGRVGCAQCYETFRAQLEPSLRRIHGSLEHKGKTPADAGPEACAKRDREHALNDLRARIAEAVREENYEEAARLRDEIRRIEEGGDGHA